MKKSRQSHTNPLPADNAENLLAQTADSTLDTPRNDEFSLPPAQPTRLQKVKSFSQSLINKVSPKAHLLQKITPKPQPPAKQDIILPHDSITQNPPKTDKFSIIIENLTFKCIIGITPKERKKKQKIAINAKIDYVFSNDAFIDYTLVAKMLKQLCKNNEYKILESALQDIAHTLKAHFPHIMRVKMSIKKLEIFAGAIVGAECEMDFSHNVLQWWREF